MTTSREGLTFKNRSFSFVAGGRVNTEYAIDLAGLGWRLNHDGGHVTPLTGASVEEFHLQAVQNGLHRDLNERRL
jgi:hypothetical protein